MIASILGQLIHLYSLIVFVNVILSWVVHTSHNMMVRRVHWATSQLVDPVLDPIRRAMSPITQNIKLDFSPFILLILLDQVSRMLG